ncbi:DUF262 domain-containing protein [Microbacterium yannicii]|uniref:DUF262 domain-containing protein n=1 Tax=Microbacterium yannicii TaxID=671622 RepID=A0ABP9M3Y4_9MICO|nr:DUF262 domain-containing protein [Microbacterium yannicii]MCO5955123.1 DUF262 domain-containing HNH endonuclease family protein [Microbacterium yannicii]
MHTPPISTGVGLPQETASSALRERYVGDIAERFWVPAYQRGYRWGHEEVERLLDDVWNSDEPSYYLQPVVVKAIPDDDRWELIDGQQRLTTLFLILAYMRNESLQSTPPPYSLDYETRPEMLKYLSDPASIEPGSNIDAFHLAGAYETITAWFEAHGVRRQFVANKLYGYFFERVRIIWYEAPEETDSATVFRRLNVGRIPLTDAELVKALLLSKVESAAPSRGRSFEVAAQWDSIERDLRNPELWAFITAGKRADSTHISLLLDAIVGGPSGRDRPLFHTFETLRPDIELDPLGVWERVLDLHSLITGWYDDRDVFHRVGFLVTAGDHLGQIVAMSVGKTKSEFDAALIGRISEHLSLSEEGVRELNYEGRSAIRSERALLLMNVETVRRQRSSSERYSFHAHAEERWSLEHIHAQSAELLTRQDQWLEWLRLHRAAISAVPSIPAAARESLETEIDVALASPKLVESTFRGIEAKVIAALGESSDVDIHSITNLALLDSGSNSALSNAVFEVKRREILRRDKRGNYIPACTRNVFLKYYTSDADQQLHFWGMADRQAYLEAILDALRPYLLSDLTVEAGAADE